MIRFTGYGNIAENRESLIYLEFLRAPCTKNYALDPKMIATVFYGLNVLYHHAEFGEIELRALVVGAKM